MMTFDAWRSAFGGAWQQFWLYPSGLSLLILAFALLLPSKVHAPKPIALPTLLVPLALLGPWVAASFLPLPRVGEIRVPLDLITWWVLLELPLFLAIAVAWRSSDQARLWAAHALAACLVAWPLVALLLGFLGWVTGSVLLEMLKTPFAWNWLFTLMWTLLLMPWLLIGPWHAPLAGWWGFALRMRQAGHFLGLALLSTTLWSFPETLDLRIIVAVFLMILLVLIAFLNRFTNPRHIIRWGQALWLSGGMVLVLFVWLTLEQVISR